MHSEKIVNAFLGAGIKPLKISHSKFDSSSIVELEKTIDTDGKIHPSTVTVARIRNSLEEEGINILIVYVDGEAVSYSTSLRMLLNKSFPDSFRNIFTSDEAENLNVYIEPKRHFESVEQNECNALIMKFIELMDLKNIEIVWISKDNLPSNTAILGTIKRIAPADVERIKVMLEAQGFSLPEIKFLQRSIDKLRKNNMIIRRKDGKYFLSAKAIEVLSTKVGRNSSDIKRVLAFKD